MQNATITTEINKENPLLLNEEKTFVNMDVKEFDKTDAYIEVSEELDDKLIKYIEREVRNSFEYRQYINYLKNELDLTKCAILKGIDIKETAVRLEFHHYPFTLFDIVGIVGKSMVENLAENEKISCFDISERVVMEHFKNNIGLVPLTLSMHKAAHNRAIFIPIEKVNGNYKEFIARYNDYIDRDLLEKVHEIELSSNDDDIKNYNEAKLKKNILNYNITYYKEL